jgi:hypothetical protein
VYLTARVTPLSSPHLARRRGHHHRHVWLPVVLELVIKTQWGWGDVPLLVVTLPIALIVVALVTLVVVALVVVALIVIALIALTLIVVVAVLLLLRCCWWR